MNEALRGYVGSIGALSILALFAASAIAGPIGYVLIGAAVLFAVLAVVAGVRRGRSAVTVISQVAVLGVFVWVLAFGVPWLFMAYMADRPIMTFGI